MILAGAQYEPAADVNVAFALCKKHSKKRKSLSYDINVTLLQYTFHISSDGPI